MKCIICGMQSDKRICKECGFDQSRILNKANYNLLSNENKTYYDNAIKQYQNMYLNRKKLLESKQELNQRILKQKEEQDDSLQALESKHATIIEQLSTELNQYEAVQIKKKRRRKLKVGDVVKLGTYPMNAKGAIKPLTWSVIEVQDGVATLLAEKVIDNRVFNHDKSSNKWVDSDLRKWLNNEFMTLSKLNEEMDIMKEQEDYVYLLSKEQYNQLDPSQRLGVATTHAKKVNSRKLNVDENGCAAWWLNDEGSSSSGTTVAAVKADGKIFALGYAVDNKGIGVRPVCKLKFKK